MHDAPCGEPAPMARKTSVVVSRRDPLKGPRLPRKAAGWDRGSRLHRSGCGRRRALRRNSCGRPTRMKEPSEVAKLVGFDDGLRGDARSMQLACWPPRPRFVGGETGASLDSTSERTRQRGGTKASGWARGRRSNDTSARSRVSILLLRLLLRVLRSELFLS